MASRAWEMAWVIFLWLEAYWWHPASLPYSSVTLLVSHAPLNYLGFFEPYVAFVFVIFIQGGLKLAKKIRGALKVVSIIQGGITNFSGGLSTYLC